MVFSTQALRRSGIAIGFVAGAFPAAALACACCADPGQRMQYDTNVDGYVAEVFNQIDFGPQAAVHLTPCGVECVQGVENPPDAYDLKLDRQAATLTFDLQAIDGVGNGSISLMRPSVIEVFATDMAPTANARNTQLYKEWRITVPVTGDGAFSALSQGENLAELVLQGTGNSCDHPGDFTHWIMTITGQGVDFRLFGKTTLKP